MKTPLPLTTETQLLLESLPAHATIHMRVAAYNAVGESAPGATATLTLG